MNKYLSIIFFLCVITTINSQELNNIGETQNIANFDKLIFEKNHQGNLKYDSINDYNVTYDRCNWYINPEVFYIFGSITTYFKPVTSLFNKIKFNLDTVLVVDSVMYHSASIPFNHSDNTLTVNLPGVIPFANLDSVTIYYGGTPISSGLGSFIQDSHNDDSIIFTLSEPYGAPDWWPCKQSLTDKIDSIDVYITTPSPNKAASAGVLSEIIPGVGDNTYHWKHRKPIAVYLIGISVTNYSVFTDYSYIGSDSIPVLNYIFPEDSASVHDLMYITTDALTFYSNTFGNYPFKDEKYGHAQFTFGGGMEHQTMSFMGGFSWTLQTHELAHQWFGDKVTCENWHDLWLNEGFATYSVGLTYDFTNRYPWWEIWKRNTVANITSQPDGSVWVSDTNDLSRLFDGRLTYNKGAYVLHMIRWIIGDSAFFLALNNYLNDPALAYGSATTAQLKSHFEAVSGKNLTTFFNDWIYGEGYPSYVLQWQQQGDELNLQLFQTTSNTSVSFFEMPVPIYIKSYNGERDTTIILDHSYSGQSFNIQIPFKIDSIIIDPELWLISANNKVISLNNDITIYPNPAVNTINISVAGSNNYLEKIQIITLNGKLILCNKYSNCRKVEINISNFSVGSYCIKIDSKNSVITHLFIKE